MLPNDTRAKLQGLSASKRALLEQRLGRVGSPIPRRLPSEPRILSFAQQQLWLIDQIAGGSAAYNVPYPVRIEGPLSAESLEQAVNAVAARHEILRTVFLNHNGQPVPALPKQWHIDLARVDLRNIPNHEREGEMWRLLKADGARPFDLARDLKLRTTLYQIGEQEYVFHHVSHHIAWDLLSKVIFYQELGQLYDALSHGNRRSLPELPIQYFDFALWQRNSFDEKRSSDLVSFWRRSLSNVPPHLELPPDHLRPPVQTLRGAKHMIAMPADLIESVRARSGECNVTPFMALLAAFKALLLCYSGQEDIVVGSPFAARPEGTERLIGIFVNTLVLRTRLALDLTFRQAMTRVRDTTLAAMAHQDCPFQKIVEAAQPPRDLSRNTLFQVNFRVQGGPLATLDLAGLATQLLRPADNGCSKFDLALELPSSPQSMGFFEYSTDLFEPATIERMAENYYALLRVVVAEPDLRLDGLPLVRAICRSCRTTRLEAQGALP